MSNVGTEIVLIPKPDWAQTLTAQTINLQSVDRRIRFIPKEKRLNLTIQDDSTQIRLSNLFQEQIKSFVSYGFLQDRNCIKVPIFFLSAFFQVIYCNLGIILTTHVQVRFGGLLPVPSSTFQNHQPVAVRLLDHCLDITSTLMRPESWLKDICLPFYSYPWSNVLPLVVM